MDKQRLDDLLGLLCLVAMLLIAVGVLCAACLGQEAAPLNELAWCRKLAPKYGVPPERIEWPLWDRSRVDLLADTEAIEVDWAHKWPEAIGQANWYAIATGRAPAVLLLVKDPEAEARYIYRCTAVCQRLGIRLYLERTN